MRQPTVIVKRMLRRFISRYRVWCNVGKELNRRASVESFLIGCAQGKNTLPDADKCRELAIKLGVPDAYRTKGDNQ